MSNTNSKKNYKNLRELAEAIYEESANIILIFGFNSVGKTQLSVEYKNLTKEKNNNKHSGVYYNSYSEDLFQWDNDPENIGNEIKFDIVKSNLNRFHSSINESDIIDKLNIYNTNFDFDILIYENREEGIESIKFYTKTSDNAIKISRGEESIFIWCFYLNLFELSGLSDEQNTHFFIDDPISSLDDNNIFNIAYSIKELINKYHKERKIIITTHHIGFFSILANWFSKGQEKDKYKNNVKKYILKRNNSEFELTSLEKDVFLYHLELLKTLQNAIDKDELYEYHFAILRQLLENISSFLGAGYFSYVIEDMENRTKNNHIADIINILSHQRIYNTSNTIYMNDNNKEVIKEIVNHIKQKYNFIIPKEKKDE
ncbi:AAA family ATPase [Brachyspira murdochii]|uniref:AAA family ATPase n=1 Tax=Brachyspira murdochii TaxID=84378 RepID=UPI0012F48B51|nr:AAA family ATPase [Brachyspira murdochii]